MHYGVELPDFDALWERAIRQEDGSISPRTENDDTERLFWQVYMQRRGGYTPDDYSRPIAQAVVALLKKHNIQSVLEIGPGWGNYTLDIARTVENVDCVDISPDVIDYILRISRENNISNVCGTASKWENFKASRPHQAVFGYNCFYRMRSLAECFRKINDTASDLCVIGMTSGPDQPFLRDFEHEMGVKVKYHRLDYIYFINVLYQLGVDANCQIIELEKEYMHEDEQELVRAETRNICQSDFSRQTALEILKRYYQLKPDGKYHFSHHFKAALIDWRPI